MKPVLYLTLTLLILTISGCNNAKNELNVEVYETSQGGNKLQQLTEFQSSEEPISITLLPENKFQTITGFGGSFTESSAYLLNEIGQENRAKIIEAYFGDSGARYSLTRTHINSCDFSLGNYSYTPVVGDKELKSFSIDEDRDDIIPMIKDAMKISTNGFKIISSPWTAPNWMKDNNSWTGGKLLPEYYDSWALYFSKYVDAYAAEGIPIWAVTVENEPLGNGGQWDSMHFSPEEMLDFVNNHLGPQFEKDEQDVKIFSYDQNRGDELIEWAEELYGHESSADYFYGTAVHWYASTVDWMPESLQYTHDIAPDKHIIQSEACVDAEVPHWQDDAWYWSKEATDWGYDWAPEHQKKDHPKYVPVYRYARDIIGCLNNWVEGWVDWNMVLDTKGGPNWAKNWCNAPVIVDPEKNEVYFTPLYHTMAHFSKYIRPDAVRIGFEISDENLMMTAAKNSDGSIAVVLLNMDLESKDIHLKLGEKSVNISINGQAIQTVLIPA